MEELVARARRLITAIFVATLSGIFGSAAIVSAADAPRPLAPPTALSLREARVIIEGAVA